MPPLAPPAARVVRTIALPDDSAVFAAVLRGVRRDPTARVDPTPVRGDPNPLVDGPAARTPAVDSALTERRRRMLHAAGVDTATLAWPRHCSGTLVPRPDKVLTGCPAQYVIVYAVGVPRPATLADTVGAQFRIAGGAPPIIGVPLTRTAGGPGGE